MIRISSHSALSCNKKILQSLARSFIGKSNINNGRRGIRCYNAIGLVTVNFDDISSFCHRCFSTNKLNEERLSKSKTKSSNASINQSDDERNNQEPKKSSDVELLSATSISFIDLYLPTRFQPYARLARMDKPIGTALLLWPCFWSTAIAASPGMLPDPKLLTLFTVGKFFFGYIILIFICFQNPGSIIIVYFLIFSLEYQGLKSKIKVSLQFYYRIVSFFNVIYSTM